MKKHYLILSIDTSCDDTAASVTDGDLVLSNIISSQVEFHKEYGGVVPNLAKRMHQQLINPVIARALATARVSLKEINAIAVTVGPGLAPALEVGVAKAKELAKKFNKPLISVNHMEGHLLSSFACNSQGQGAFSKTGPRFPILGLLVSGGHTQLVLMMDFGKYQLLGETLDDAAGEAFDKVAKMLGLGYPGGPIMSELAKTGISKYELPVPMIGSKDLNFSFSGLKTACLYKLQKLAKPWDKQFYCDFAASFEKVAIESLMIKLKKAIEIYHPKQIVLGGGVINNLKLRKEARRTAKQFGLRIFIPYSEKLFSDNAAMIGICAFHQAQRNDFVKKIDLLDRQPNLKFIDFSI
ncbi:tRNA (adenosine(37)-N6)-threonylcarbamoyltransferase complex transferase subunit TsaD [Candidatus Parcubacteria bacterium]|nr:tRNA (adenosine(37)-N6)-threonylcarbamoyltransferase complex transferase subunit TsaD [Candidatus Parcubacteria bacterium]